LLATVESDKGCLFISKTGPLDAWAAGLLVAGPDEGLAMAQRMGLDVLFLLRRDEGLVELGLGRFGNSTGATPPDRPITG
jgi:thiamine biosynthesis lipoprotein